MRCAYCLQPVRPWQSRRPLGGGWLADSFGQFEHSECQDRRFKSIAEGNRRFIILMRKLYKDEVQPQ